MPSLSKAKQNRLARKLAAGEPLFSRLHTQFGYPPLFIRDSGFVTLLRIILEQQVSIASADAVYLKLLQATQR